MSFSDDIRRWNVKVEDVTQAVFVGSVAGVKESIQFGSPLTGSPGQPVDQDILRPSWQSEFTDPHNAVVSTNVPWAPQNEDGIARPGGGPYVQRSAVGGRFSVALTRMNYSRIVDDVANKLTKGGDPRPSGFQDNSVLGGSGS